VQVKTQSLLLLAYSCICCNLTLHASYVLTPKC